MLTQFYTVDVTIQFRYRNDTTQCLILDNEDGFIVGFGSATRYPYDQPNRVMGEKFALTHALENSTLGREQRTSIWKKFHGK